MTFGILLAVLSGVCNGLFTAPMKMKSYWKWENTWLGFIVVACMIMPLAMVAATVPGWTSLVADAPRAAVAAAMAFGFAWGFGAISFGLGVDSLGVSIANSLVIGLSSALGSLVPLILEGHVEWSARVLVLFAGVAAFLAGVGLCGAAGLARDRAAATGTAAARPSMRGYVFAVAAGVMSAVFNIGFTLALPIAKTATARGLSEFDANNCIWVLMLEMGSIPNVAYCAWLMRRNGTGKLLTAPHAPRGWAVSAVMGLLWGGSIFLYGAAVPRLGELGPSVGWPLSLAVGLAVANVMGILLGEWRTAPRDAAMKMRWGLCLIGGAIALCAVSTRMG